MRESASLPPNASSSHALVGRSREQVRLRAALRAATQGQGGLVFVSGEAGIGKTALVEDLASVAAEQGVLVLTGHCYDLSVTPPYGPWVEIGRHFRPSRDLPAALPFLGDSPAGSLTALDLDATNLALAEERVAQSPLCCPVSFTRSSVTSIPFADATFDAVWCANVSQYLTDDELREALAQFRRVVRRGGIVAVKEADGASAHYDPIDIGLFRRQNLQGLAHGNVQARGVMRAAIMRRWLERAGLRDVWQQVFLEEAWAPLTDLQRRAAGNMLRYLAAAAEQVAIPEEDRAFWRA
jgi:SAM-dependent methyltransferase